MGRSLRMPQGIVRRKSVKRACDLGCPVKRFEQRGGPRTIVGSFPTSLGLCNCRIIACGERLGGQPIVVRTKHRGRSKKRSHAVLIR